MIIKTKIKTDKKVNPLYARYVIRRDQKMMLKAAKLEKEVIEGLKAERSAIPVLVEYGLITEEEGVEISMNILKAIGASAGRDPLEVCKRITTLSTKRIAEKLGGEVVEGGDTE